MSEILHLLQQARVEVREKGTNVGSEHINICCPYCGEEKFHCGIHEFDLWFKCFVCGEGGSWKKFKTKLKKLYPKIKWDSISHYNEIYLESEKIIIERENPVFWREICEKDRDILDWLKTPPERSILKDTDRQRGLPLSIAMDAGLMIGTKKLGGYIVFNLNGNVNARKFTDKAVGPRWWKQLVDSPYLFGKEFCEKTQPPVGVITEGIFDCLRIPLGNSVAILGSAVSDALIVDIARVFKNTKTLILAMDRDANSKAVVTMRLILLDLGYEVKVVDWNLIKDPEIKDLDELYLTTTKEKFFKFLGTPQFIDCSYSLL